MTITLQTVNELIQSLESAGELSIKETKVMALAKAYQQMAAENVALRNSSSHVLQSGEPPKTYREEWFIARVKGHGFAVLRSLPEEYSYDYTTLDATYFRKDFILEWMQLPNSEFLPNVETPATDAFLAGIKADGRAEGINFTAGRLAAAFNHGFVDKPMAEVFDVVRMILTAKEDLANNPAEDGLSGEYAEKALAEWEVVLREGADIQSQSRSATLAGFLDYLRKQTENPKSAESFKNWVAGVVSAAATYEEKVREGADKC